MFTHVDLTCQPVDTLVTVKDNVLVSLVIQTMSYDDYDDDGDTDIFRIFFSFESEEESGSVWNTWNPRKIC